ncbi:ABC-F family ATP-binding cassette domain-containing protein [Candidatus Saccharibacteria bacterium]|nr:ABC-F family ATP-binding cassette domain-containing protein [Candidatus Saccharibacteria bacterium]
MFTLQHINKSYNDKTILDDVSLSVNSGEVVALIGKNGAGKTTLLKVVNGEISADSGHSSERGETIGYVPQEARLGLTIENSFNKTIEPWRVEYALNRVGLDQKALRSQVSELSGGQKTRLAFATILAADPEPTALLLDEPTNNLDAEGLAWLEQFIKSFQGEVLLVSHDREFINRVATKIIELDKGKLRQYGGNYDFYKQQKQIEYESKLAKYEKSVEERRRLEKAITAQSEKSQHTHGHIKRADNDKYQRDFFRNRVTVKYGQQAKAIAGRLDQLEVTDKPENSKDYKVTLRGEVPSGKLMLRLDKINKAFDTNVLQDIELEIRGNERLHITGGNGSGKTTMLKVASGLVEPDIGEVILGTGISMGYFSQDINGLNHDESALKNLQSTGAKTTALYREARSLGLTNLDLQKRVAELSRGQQAKLGFAKLLLDAHHLLILDEPTNHLDIPTREQIEAALQQYNGAILFASHDKYFGNTLRITKTLNLAEGRLQ